MNVISNVKKLTSKEREAHFSAHVAASLRCDFLDISWEKLYVELSVASATHMFLVWSLYRLTKLLKPTWATEVQ